ncbi:hypothetical protein MPTK1_2g03860 [Marchantia polymorpha subsp. ruderalis]|uniref:Uncharacterized protein n=1 Tax=Marchantia polymorpha TaxID=3197 RepID=A0A2R6X7H6_MARPO|nr:hypothetical protein MARPO_0031s0042 [Marchantia polymorpha]BBN01003.1 hypothetical protein Mp_2g03860 [Marchantia polymorpha subsp. ruderalis]|eukprot:PTQ42052.1 hypothetical protein MARPO_0031s0042 [Marchantia polymorpha]
MREILMENIFIDPTTTAQHSAAAVIDLLFQTRSDWRDAAGVGSYTGQPQLYLSFSRPPFYLSLSRCVRTWPRLSSVTRTQPNPLHSTPSYSARGQFIVCPLLSLSSPPYQNHAPPFRFPFSHFSPVSFPPED